MVEFLLFRAISGYFKNLRCCATFRLIDDNVHIAGKVHVHIEGHLVVAGEEFRTFQGPGNLISGLISSGTYEENLI